MAASSHSSTWHSRSIATAKMFWYQTLRVLVGVSACLVFRMRAFNVNRLPREGGALLVSNHQSHLDPPLIGQAVPRRINYLARRTLFTFILFRWLIQSLDAIPIDRDGSGIGGIKETMRRLRRGGQVLMFPEGTRTSDGEMNALKPGFIAMVRRAKVPIVPLAIEGSFQAWPRTRHFPQCGTIHIHIGRLITPAEQASLDDDALVALVERLMRECHEQARVSRARAVGYSSV